MIFRCRVCGQPIGREAAVRTKAGGFTNGYCQMHLQETVDVSSTVLAAPMEEKKKEEKSDV